MTTLAEGLKAIIRTDTKERLRICAKHHVAEMADACSSSELALTVAMERERIESLELEVAHLQRVLDELTVPRQIAERQAQDAMLGVTS